MSYPTLRMLFNKPHAQKPNINQTLTTMTTTNSFEPKTIIVCFHVGRGGYHNNPGHKTYCPYVKNLQEFVHYNNAFINFEDEDGNELPDDEWTLTDQGGNIILEGREEIESPVGVLYWDYDYDTDIAQYIEDCDEEEIDLIYNTLISGTEFVDKDVADYVCRKKGMKRVVDEIGNISLSQSAMKVTHQDGIDTYERDTFEGMDEYDVRKFLKEERFTPDSIREIVLSMKIKEWL